MMKIPLYLAVAQWALLLALALLVIILYRQLGRVLGKSKAPPELGPQVGTKAAEFGYERVSDNTRHEVSPGDGRPSLVAFVDPTCPSCEQLVENLSLAAEAGDLDGFRVLLLTSEPPSYLQISDTFRRTQLEIGRTVTHGARDAYRAFATPLLVAIDGDGTVRAAGTVREMKDVRGFIQACLLPAPDATLAVLHGRAGRNGKADSPVPPVELNEER